MRRFYFHQCISDERLIDPDGFDYPDLATARQSALMSARSLWAAAILDHVDLRNQAIEIANEDGEVLDTVNLMEALPSYLRKCAA